MASEHLHAAIVHFTIASFLISVVFDLLWLIKKNNHFRIVSWYNLLIAGSSVIISVLTGLQAEEEVVVFSQGAKEIIEIHETLAFVSISCVLAQMLWRIGISGQMPKKKPGLYHIIGIVGVFSVLATGFFGGKMVLDFGVGVRKIEINEKQGEMNTTKNAEDELIKKNIQFLKPDTVKY